MRKVHWVAQSSDAKTGKVIASYSPISTCPDSCSFKQGGCYAWGLFYLKILGNKIDSGRVKAKTLMEAIKDKNKSCRIVRHRVAGDVVGDVEETLNECEIVHSNGLTNIGYTHHWKSKEAQPLSKWFRASCNSVDDLREAAKLGWSTTVAVHGDAIPKRLVFEGKKYILCPARHGEEGKKDITCNDCTLCKVTDKTKDYSIMFEVHGSKGTIKKATNNSVDINELITSK